VVRGLWHGLLALLGIGSKKKKTESVIEEEERYHHHRRGSSHAHRDTHGSWYSGRPASAAARKEKGKSSSGAGLLGMGAALGTLALLLGLRRDKDKKKAAPSKTTGRSDVSSSYWSDSYTATSPSELFVIQER
jgi:outer membrane receptor protein involved in Fe transport